MAQRRCEGDTMTEISTNPRVRRRFGGPTVAILVDFLAQARATRNWLVLIVVVVAIVAAITAFVGQTVVPWAIYPAL